MFVSDLACCLPCVSVALQDVANGDDIIIWYNFVLKHCVCVILQEASNIPLDDCICWICHIVYLLSVSSAKFSYFP